MSRFDFDIGIIGGGAAGLTVAAGAARLGARTLLIEKEGRLGGDCLHYGCVPSKTLIETARVRHLVKKAGAFGLPPLDLRPVDFHDVSKRIRSVISVIQKHDSVERFRSLGAEVEFGDASFADEHSIRLGSRIYSARNWVIATGSSPSVPAIDGLDKTPFITNREVYWLDRLPASMIILGAGPVGIEMAQAFCRLGTEVTVVHRGRQILSREDPDMAALVQDVLAAEGVSFCPGSKILTAGDTGVTKEIVLSRDGETITLSAEVILIATGRKANLEGLGLDRIGIGYGERGLELDDRMRTSRRHIYAAGDVTGRYLFTHAAGYEGGIVISNAIFRLSRKADYSLLPWCTYTDPELASIGMNEKAAAAAAMDYRVLIEEFKTNDRGLAADEATGRIKLLLDRRGKPLGVQIFGPHGGELIGEWVSAMNGKVGMGTLASAVHPYPTLCEINKRVAGNYLAERIFSEKVRKGLKLFFGLKGRALGS